MGKFKQAAGAGVNGGPRETGVVPFGLIPPRLGVVQTNFVGPRFGRIATVEPRGLQSPICARARTESKVEQLGYRRLPR